MASLGLFGLCWSERELGVLCRVALIECDHALDAEKKNSRRSELLQKARLGDARAQFELGCDYDFESPKNRRPAVFWYRKAAERGYSEAQNYLPECLRAGIGVRKSVKEAAGWFRKAAEKGDVDAQVSLGCQLFYGAGVKKDWAEALS